MFYLTLGVISFFSFHSFQYRRSTFFFFFFFLSIRRYWSIIIPVRNALRLSKVSFRVLFIRVNHVNREKNTHSFSWWESLSAVVSSGHLICVQQTVKTPATEKVNPFWSLQTLQSFIAGKELYSQFLLLKRKTVHMRIFSHIFR